MAYMIVNSRYNPYTYDELVKPLVDYTTAYEKQETALNDLATRAAVLENLSPDTDSEQYNSYRSWLAELQQASSSLASSGLSPQLRSTLNTLNNRYSSEYAPLEDKIKKRSELISEQRAFQQKNPGAIFDVDYSTVALGEISPNSTYHTYDLEDILAKVGKDVYSRSYNGEALPSIEDYVNKYSKGLEDPVKLQMIRDAVTSGASVGVATYKQKALEEGLSRARVGNESRSQALQLLRLQMDNPQFVYDANGRPKMDEKGNFVTGEGWKQDVYGRWYNSDLVDTTSTTKTGGTQTSKPQTQREPYIGVVVFKNGNPRYYKDDTDFNSANASLHTTLATKASDISASNIQYLATLLGLDPDENPERVFSEAIRRGNNISIKGDASSTRQTMVVRGTKTQITNAEAPAREAEGDDSF